MTSEIVRKVNDSSIFSFLVRLSAVAVPFVIPVSLYLLTAFVDDRVAAHVAPIEARMSKAEEKDAMTQQRLALMEAQMQRGYLERTQFQQQTTQTLQKLAEAVAAISATLNEMQRQQSNH